jgi:signal transduction histidine kinase
VLDKVAAGFSALDVTVSDLLHFTSDRDPQLARFPLRGLVEEMLASLALQFEAQAVRSVIEIPADGQITADREMIRRALLNLVLNAVDAMPRGGTLTVRLAHGPQGVELQVADTGEGLSEDALHRAFEPFYTTKAGGTGLGLAIVYRIAEVHRGAVAAANDPHGGAVFTVRLPNSCQEVAA